MFKVDENLYINLNYISTIYKNQQDGIWRLVMVGATDIDEYQLSDEEAKKVLDAIEEKSK